MFAGLGTRSIQGANDRITLGLIGCGRQGRRDLLTALRSGESSVFCKTLADPDDNQTAIAMRALDDLGHDRRRERFKDYRRILDDRSVDAVLIATPDHWHALAVCDALSAGKDVYLAAPAVAAVGELAPVLSRGEASGRVVQLGLENRSLSQQTELLSIVAERLGLVTGVRAWSFAPGAQPLAPEAPATPPAYCDYDMWLGPAPDAEFTMNRFHGRHHWFWDYGGGHLSREGVVWLDLAAQLLGLRQPRRVLSSGGKVRFPADERETPDTQTALWTFERFDLTWRHGLGTDASEAGYREGIAFEGSEGALIVHSSGWELRAGNHLAARGSLPEADALRMSHMGNFLACLRSRERPTADLAATYYSTLWCHMANASLRCGEPIVWDAGAGAPARSEAAGPYLYPTYRAPWRLSA